MPLAPRVHHRAYRDAQYTRTFKTVFSHALFALMKRTCVDSDKVTGMLDVRLSDSEVDSDPSNYGNDVRMKVTRPVRILVADPSRVRVRVYWSEMVKGAPARLIRRGARTSSSSRKATLVDRRRLFTGCGGWTAVAARNVDPGFRAVAGRCPFAWERAVAHGERRAEVALTRWWPPPKPSQPAARSRD